jgi:fucose permease
LNSHKPYLIFIAYAVFVAIGIASGLLNIAWTYMQPTFNVSLDSLGTLLTAGTIGGLIAAFMSGYIIGKFTIGKVILAGLLLAGFGLIGYGIAPMWVVLLFIAFITSIGKGTIDAGLNNFVSANYGASEMNWLHACWGIGLTIAPMIVTYITINLNQSWQVAYWIMGGLVIGLGVLVLLSLPQWRLNVPQNDESGHDDHGATLGETVRQPIVILSVLFFFIYGGLEIGTGQLANTLFIESREIPLAIASNWVSAYWGSFTIGRMLMGLLALRIGDKPLLYASLSMGVVGSFLLFLNLSDALSLTGLLLLGFGQAAIFPILISQTPHRVGIRHAANTIGFQVGFAGMGGATLAGIAGVVAENFGIETISAFLFITAIVLFSLYQLIIWWENQPPVMTNINRG